MDCLILTRATKSVYIADKQRKPVSSYEQTLPSFTPNRV